MHEPIQTGMSPVQSQSSLPPIDAPALARELRAPLEEIATALSAFLDRAECPECCKCLAAQVAAAAAFARETIGAASGDAATPGWSEFSLASVCAKAAETARRLCPHPTVTVNIECDGAMEPVKGDAEGIQRALASLLFNALRRTERGIVTLRAARLPGRPQRVRIEVCDSGRALDLSGEEPGLGLWLCRCIAGAHGGWVSGRSSPSGSTFAAVIRADLSGPRRLEQPDDVVFTDESIVDAPLEA